MKSLAEFHSTKHIGFLSTPETLLHPIDGTERKSHNSPDHPLACCQDINSGGCKSTGRDSNLRLTSAKPATWPLWGGLKAKFE